MGVGEKNVSALILTSHLPQNFVFLGKYLLHNYQMNTNFLKVQSRMKNMFPKSIKQQVRC